MKNKKNTNNKFLKITFYVCLIVAFMLTVISIAGCDSQNSAKTPSPSTDTQTPGNGNSANDGKYSITYSGETKYFISGPSGAKKGEEITVKAEIPMEGVLALYLNGSVLRPSGTDENDQIIYEFTMPGENVQIDFQINIP